MPRFLLDKRYSANGETRSEFYTPLVQITLQTGNQDEMSKVTQSHDYSSELLSTGHPELLPINRLRFRRQMFRCKVRSKWLGVSK